FITVVVGLVLIIAGAFYFKSSNPAKTPEGKIAIQEESEHKDSPNEVSPAQHDLAPGGKSS
ncbi:MAG: hypothetical protein ABI743_15195, partial [bacterium]